MKVIQLTPAHLQPYRALMLHAYEHSPDSFTSTAQERAAEPDSFWTRRLADPSGTTASFGAFDGDALVGTVALEFSIKPKTRHKVNLIGMYVRAEARRKGVAQALMRAAIDFCKARGGIAVVHLTVTDGNEPASALYSSFGFGTFGIEPKAMRVGTRYLTKRHMWLDLEAEEASPGLPKVNLEELAEALECASAGEAYGSAAYVDKTTGHVIVDLGEYQPDDPAEELPADLQTNDRYVVVPSKRDLDLARELVFRFVATHLPKDERAVSAMFRRAGAYRRFRALVEERDAIDLWYAFEHAETRRTLVEWCEESGFAVDRSPARR